MLALLCSAVAGTQLSLLAKANPAPLFYPRNPVIDIESPTNRTYNVTSLPLKVTIETFNNYFEAAEGTVTEGLVSYSLDGENSQLIGNTTFRGQSPMPAGYTPGKYTTFATSAVLSELREGSHNLTVRAQYDYIETYDRSQDEHRESESSVFFRVDTAPQNISLVTPENSTYMSADVPLQFSIDEPASWVGYSLDGQDNVTVAGNMTLPELSVGQHALMLYANDMAGNPAVSQTVTFSVAEPFPTTLVITISGVSLAVVGAGLLVYFKKRKIQRTSAIRKVTTVSILSVMETRLLRFFRTRTRVCCS
jgi:hypothetical protein